jgi:hypothetical protein
MAANTALDVSRMGTPESVLDVDAGADEPRRRLGNGFTAVAQFSAQWANVVNLSL